MPACRSEEGSERGSSVTTACYLGEAHPLQSSHRYAYHATMTLLLVSVFCCQLWQLISDLGARHQPLSLNQAYLEGNTDLCQ